MDVIEGTDLLLLPLHATEATFSPPVRPASGSENLRNLRLHRSRVLTNTFVNSASIDDVVMDVFPDRPELKKFAEDEGLGGVTSIIGTSIADSMISPEEWRLTEVFPFCWCLLLRPTKKKRSKLLLLMFGKILESWSNVFLLVC